MKMHVSRLPELASSDNSAPIMAVSLQASRSLATLMQYAGVKSIRLGRRPSIGGWKLVRGSDEPFDGVPAPLAAWAPAAVDGIGSCMAALGIESISMEPESSDEEEGLRAVWARVCEEPPADAQAAPAGTGGEPPPRGPGYVEAVEAGGTGDAAGGPRYEWLTSEDSAEILDEILL